VLGATVEEEQRAGGTGQQLELPSGLSRISRRPQPKLAAGRRPREELTTALGGAHRGAVASGGARSGAERGSVRKVISPIWNDFHHAF
jgi:hypothetical protein